MDPPTNVTLHCHNLHDHLQWSYEPLMPGLRFRVEIRSVHRCFLLPLTQYPNSCSSLLLLWNWCISFVLFTSSTPKEMWVDPPALHANISFLTDPMDDNMLTVTAVIGQNKSKPAGGTTFSYSKVSLVKQKCECLSGMFCTRGVPPQCGWDQPVLSHSNSRLCGLPICCCQCWPRQSHSVQLQPPMAIVQLWLPTDQVQEEEKQWRKGIRVLTRIHIQRKAQSSAYG